MTDGFGSWGGAVGAPESVASRGMGEAPQPPADLTKTLSVPPWDQQKPPTAQDFYTYTPNLLTLPNGAGQTVASTQATGGFVKLGADNIGILQQLIFTVDAPTTAMSMQVSVLQNGTALPGLAAVGFPPINASSFAFPLGSIWQLQAGAVLSVVFLNLNAQGPWKVGIVLSGYQVSAADVYLYTGQRQGMIETAADLARSRRYLAR